MTPEERIAVYERFLSDLALNPALRATKSVEVDLRGPLNPSNDLDALFFGEERFLGFRDFFSFYISAHEKQLKSLHTSRYSAISWDDFCEGLRARLYRTQFGFLTEYHAYFMAQSVFGEGAVVRSTDLDVHGIDFQILHAGKTYNVHIFVDSPRARRFRQFKSAYKNTDSRPGIHVDLPYALRGNTLHALRFLPNGFGVYTRRYLEYLKREIESGNLDNASVAGINESGFIYEKA